MANDSDSKHSTEGQVEKVVGSETSRPGKPGRAFDGAIGDSRMELRGPEPWDQPKPPVSKDKGQPKE